MVNTNPLADMLRCMYPELTADDSKSLATKVAKIVERVIKEGRDAQQVTLMVRGGARTSPLATELRKARELIRLTQQQVAEAIECSSAKIMRIETGRVRISKSDLLTLLKLYQVDDKETERLLALKRN